MKQLDDQRNEGRERRRAQRAEQDRQVEARAQKAKQAWGMS
jgi:hypothetical protein